MTPPVVRYMIVCRDWAMSPSFADQVDVYGVLSHLQASHSEPYPLRLEEICVVLILTNLRGVGKLRIACTWEESGELVFSTPPHTIAFGNDPLHVLGLPFRIRNCPFPRPGVYAIQLWYNETVLCEQTLSLR